jgi:hypothetical protein
VSGQRFRLFEMISMPELGVFLSRLSARFSFNDFPDFLDMLERGDLSDIADPLIGGLGGPDLSSIRVRGLMRFREADDIHQQRLAVSDPGV